MFQGGRPSFRQTPPRLLQADYAIDKRNAAGFNLIQMFVLDLHWLIQILMSAFLAILFLQSGIDKVVDRRGNLDWLTSHFAKSPLRSVVPAMFAVLTLIELAAGLLSAIGCVVIIISHEPRIALYGAIVSAIAILCLFFGQRIAKEYAGAAVLVPYFLLAILAIYELQ